MKLQALPAPRLVGMTPDRSPNSGRAGLDLGEALPQFLTVNQGFRCPLVPGRRPGRGRAGLLARRRSAAMKP